MTGSKAGPKDTRADLATYRSKRDPTRTPEPMGGGPEPGADRPTFVIQEHHARALHWDFRLEHDGVLVSWALPKGLPVDPGRNHLAVHTEDHPLEYATFEGDIPAGEYGGGGCRIWDRGTYECEKWTDDEVMVVLHGGRAEGRYVLFPTKGQELDDPPDGPGAGRLRPAPDVGQADAGGRGGAPGGRPRVGLRDQVGRDPGHRFVEGGRVRVQSRNGRDLTGQFPELRGLGRGLGAPPAVLDGEIVVLGEDGGPTSTASSTACSGHAGGGPAPAADEPANMVIFDVLYLDGASLLGEPYDARRDRLESLAPRGARLRHRRLVPGPAGRATCSGRPRRSGWRGWWPSGATRHYRPGRREPQWVKVKNVRTQEVVVGGWTTGQGSGPAASGHSCSGIPDGEGAPVRGQGGHRLLGADRRALLQRFQPLAARPARSPPPWPGAR